VAGDEVEGGVVHAAHQFGGLGDDGRAVAPGEDGGEEAGDLDILSAGIAVRDGDGVAADELGPVVQGDASVEEGLEGRVAGGRVSGGDGWGLCRGRRQDSTG